MSSHPINLMIRFLLEMASLFSAGIWGWEQNETWLRYILAIGIPLIFAAIWGIFAVPDDPSRSGKTVIATPGIIRLAIELGFFGFATWTLYDINLELAGLILGIMVLLHYATSYDRIKWLISH